METVFASSGFATPAIACIRTATALVQARRRRPAWLRRRLKGGAQ